jgi:hypothetical protein
MSSEKSVEVDVPELEGGEKKFDSGEFGALARYLMLSEPLPLPEVWWRPIRSCSWSTRKIGASDPAVRAKIGALAADCRR